ncbi:MAG TPA: isoprenylcysteine carboxylmethyltransferase family protein [Gemmatimonadota bacterium]|nr:isoprenylcysteine carboxylmethyltransferase family protein [Gemmatimonadota bacterium]
MRPLPPPVVAFALFAAAWLVDFRVDPARLVPPPWNELGFLLLLLGPALVLWPMGLFRRAKTSYLPEDDPRELVLAGPYRFTRNPMYLGVATVLTGLALLVGTWPFFLVPVAFVLVMNATQISREEVRLERRFGAEYEAYRRRVRRWI